MDNRVSAASYRLAGAVLVVAIAAGVAVVVWLVQRGDASGAAPLPAPAEVGVAGDWAAANADLAGTRAAVGSAIDASSVGRLRRVWTFRYPAAETFSGVAASTPIVAGDRVYTQDLASNVYALDRSDGRLVWRRRYGRESGGPNGVAIADGVLFGNTDLDAFALDAATGRQLWRRRLGTTREPITIQPAVAGDLVLTSTTAQGPGARGDLIALDREAGTVRWRFDTIEDPWRFPDAYGGGAWQTPTVDDDGRVYWGTTNPNPWGGTRRRPNGGSYPGPVRWTDSLVVLDGPTGAVAWADQVTRHDIRDLDFQNPPVLVSAGGRDLVLGSGKSGRVIAWDRATGERVWEREVGLHRNDTGSLPRRPVSVCPGFLGGVETPAAYADGLLFVPVVDLCFPESSRGTSAFSFFDFDYAKGRGRLVALDASTGRVAWERRLGSAAFGCATVANDVVFTATYDGWISAFATEDGRPLWRQRARAGINACPAVAGDTLLVQAGTDHPAFVTDPPLELEAFRLG